MTGAAIGSPGARSFSWRWACACIESTGRASGTTRYSRCTLAAGRSRNSPASSSGTTSIPRCTTTCSMAGLRAVYFLPFKEDYRAAVTHVAERQRPGDCGIFLPARKWGARPDYWYVYQRDSAPPRLVDAGAAAAGRSACERVWLVWDRTWWLNREPAASASVKQSLESSLTRVGGARYFEMEVGLYGPRP